MVLKDKYEITKEEVAAGILRIGDYTSKRQGSLKDPFIYVIRSNVWRRGKDIKDQSGKSQMAKVSCVTRKASWNTFLAQVLLYPLSYVNLILTTPFLDVAQRLRNVLRL